MEYPGIEGGSCRGPKEAAEDRKKHDESKVKDIMMELKTEDVTIKNFVWVGRGGRYPGGILVITNTIKECNSVADSAN